MIKDKTGFTLIELLVVISIIGILLALSMFGFQGAREASRDAGRKADLEQIRSALEMYKADCDNYPASLTSPLKGDGSTPTCATANIYLASIPDDPLNPARRYLYSRLTKTSYELCAALEQGAGAVTCGESSNCGAACNYKVTNP